MVHTGTLFLSRTRPQAGPARCGAFQLHLHCYDRIGPHQTESWRITWTGPAARRFWERHERDLKAGAALSASLEKARTHTLYTRPPQCEIHARVLELELIPRAQTVARTAATA